MCQGPFDNRSQTAPTNTFMCPCGLKSQTQVCCSSKNDLCNVDKPLWNLCVLSQKSKAPTAVLSTTAKAKERARKKEADKGTDGKPSEAGEDHACLSIKRRDNMQHLKTT